MQHVINPTKSEFVPHGTKNCRIRSYWNGSALHPRNTEHKKTQTEGTHWIWAMCSSLSLLQIRWTFKDSDLYYKDATYQEAARAGFLLTEHEPRAPTTKSSPSPKQGRHREVDRPNQESYPEAVSEWQGRSEVRPGSQSIDKDNVQQLPSRSFTKTGVNPSWGAAWATAMFWLYRWSALLQCSYSKESELRAGLK